MDLGISGRAAIVAAASKGLGNAVALGLAKEGASVAICARCEMACWRQLIRSGVTLLLESSR